MIFIYILVALFVVAIIKLNASKPKTKGSIGERRVRILLEQLGKEYVSFHDLYVPKKDGKTTQIDHVLLSPYGIFVIETKNYSGWIFGQEQQKNWTQAIYKKKSQFYNPILQNKTHVNALQHYLQTDIPLHSVIVFSDAVTFKFKEPFTQALVIQNHQLKQMIQQFTARQIPAEQLASFNERLKQLQAKSAKEIREIKSEHLQRVKGKPKPSVVKNANMQVVDSSTTEELKILHRKQSQILVTVNNDIASTKAVQLCPKCSSELVLRNSKRGQFYGCQAFPRCRYTKDMA